MKKITLIAIIAVSSLIIGCIPSQTTPQFFGIRILHKAQINEALTWVIRRKERGVFYGHNEKLADSSVYCYATVESYSIYFSLYNESKLPIRMNYFADTYELKTKDDKIFALEIQTDIKYYPSILNPGESQTVRVKLPETLDESVVELIGIELDYGNVAIGFRRIQES